MRDIKVYTEPIMARKMDSTGCVSLSVTSRLSVSKLLTRGRTCYKKSDDDVVALRADAVRFVITDAKGASPLVRPQRKEKRPASVMPRIAKTLTAVFAH